MTEPQRRTVRPRGPGPVVVPTTWRRVRWSDVAGWRRALEAAEGWPDEDDDEPEDDEEDEDTDPDDPEDGRP